VPKGPPCRVTAIALQSPTNPSAIQKGRQITLQDYASRKLQVIDLSADVPPPKPASRGDAPCYMSRLRVILTPNCSWPVMQVSGISPELSAEIERLMQLQPVATSQPEDAIDFARESGGLLFGWSWSSTILRPNGEVVDWDKPHPPTVSASPSAVLQALGHAATVYPTLAQFIPARPSESVDCHFCGATGKVTDAGSLSGFGGRGENSAA